MNQLNSYTWCPINSGSCTLLVDRLCICPSLDLGHIKRQTIILNYNRRHCTGRRDWVHCCAYSRIDQRLNLWDRYYVPHCRCHTAPWQVVFPLSLEAESKERSWLPFYHPPCTLSADRKHVTLSYIVMREPSGVKARCWTALWLY